MCGKSVLGNAHWRPVASVIDDGVDGYLCAGARGLAGCIRMLIDQPEHAAVLGRAGYAKASSRYTWDAIAHRVRDLCQAVSAAHDGGAHG